MDSSIFIKLIQDFIKMMTKKTSFDFRNREYGIKSLILIFLFLERKNIKKFKVLRTKNEHQFESRIIFIDVISLYLFL